MPGTSIKLTQTHECSEDRCGRRFMPDPRFQQDPNVDYSNFSNCIGVPLSLQPNPDFKDGKCPESGESEGCCVSIASFDVDNYENNEDYNQFDDQNEVVITDEEIQIAFNYPLSEEVLFTYRSPGGFTRLQLVQHIVRTYRRIYQEEEETASERTFEYQGKCTKCKNEVLLENRVETYATLKQLQVEAEAKNLPAEERDEALKYLNTSCPMCLAEYQDEEELRVLPCHHVGHKCCFDTWLHDRNNAKKRCMICQDQAATTFQKPCGKCEGGQVSFSFTGKVLPMELRQARGGLINRHQTDGRYGIWGHDIGDLVIEGIYYDSDKKIVGLSIGS